MTSESVNLFPPSTDCLVIGSALWDVIGRAEFGYDRGDDRPGRIAHLPGGVALNVAIGLARIGRCPALLTYLGDDPEGDALARLSEQKNVFMGAAIRGGFGPTDVYMAIEDPGGIVAAIADAHSLEQAGSAILAPYPEGWQGPVVIDGNLTEPMLAELAMAPRLSMADLRVVPASPGKVLRLAPFLARPGTVLYINRGEAETLGGRRFHSAAEAAEALAGPARLIVTDGPALAADADGHRVLTAEPPEVPNPLRVTGAGDRLLATHLAAEMTGVAAQDALAQAVAAAAALISGESE